MRKILAVVGLLWLVSLPAGAYNVLYKEQFYRLYHQHFYQYPERCAENIWYLEQALKADFANPLYALANIKDQRDWERYRYLFTMHANLRLVDLYLTWGRQYDKMVAYFYNYPWRNDNLKSLERAESLYQYAQVYWAEAQTWSKKAWALRGVHLPEIQYWEDESHRIETGGLDYQKIIEKHLRRLRDVRARFEAMDQTTY